MTREFDFIARYAPTGASRNDVILGSGDDAALLQVPPGKILVATVDTLVGGRHFPMNTEPCDIGWKALAVNLSDLAAMGAEPAWVTVALTLAAGIEDMDHWMAGFSAGIQDLAEQCQVAIVGGDLSCGPLSVTVQALGYVDEDKALRRDGAQTGDIVAVTGTLGDAMLALHLLHNNEQPSQALRKRLNRPTPRLAAGRVLSGIAHAAIDISDGLVADLGHILKASGVGARMDVTRVPRSEAFTSHCPPHLIDRLPLAGGDDYELCVCLPAAALAAAQDSVPDLTVIGEIVDEPGCRLVDDKGEPVHLEVTGYDHFANC